VLLVGTDSEADWMRRFFPESVRHQNLSFCGRKWWFGLVCLRNDIYLSGGGVQATLHNNGRLYCLIGSRRRQKG